MPQQTVVLSGSIATDHLMQFAGRFSDAILPGSLHKLSVSFLVDDLVVRYGGVGANIAFGLGLLGRRPVLVGAVGDDFDAYGEWLTRHGVDIDAVRVSRTAHTARFTATSDGDLNQVASFYPGAMSEARDIDLTDVLARTGGAAYVVISPNDPDAMLRHAREAKAAGVPIVADPSQQMAFMAGEALRPIVDGADLLITNDYERDLLAVKTGWSQQEISDRVGTRITTLGAGGIEIAIRGGETVTVPAVPARAAVDPTGVGDAFRAGLLAGLSTGLERVPSARLGALIATFALEAAGPQDYTIDAADARTRLAETYGAAAAAELDPLLPA